MDIDRILKNIQKDSNGCWIWQRSCNSAGYGQLTENKRYWLAHRYAYQCYYSDLLDEDIVRHSCHTPKCCNPEHLIKGSNLDNWHDSADTHRRTHRERSFGWIIGDIEYISGREAIKATGMSFNTLIKYTDPVSRVFDIESYRNACKISNCKPKI